MGDELTRRKDEHVDIVLGGGSERPPAALGFGRWTLEYDALPEVDLDAVDLSTTVLGKRLSAPIVVGAMTGGTSRTAEINRTLALAAERVGIGMALGSQRAMIRHPEAASSFAVRDAAPNLPLLLGNVGAVQLNYGVTAQQVAEAVRAVGADALNLHLNPLQEAIQPEGDTRFSGLATRIDALVRGLDVPCLVKEVGAGISPRAARKLAALPLAGIEASGTGGTSWAAVEAHRASPGTHQRAVGERLAGWGVPTVPSIRACREAFGDRLVIGSGGVRQGMDIAVALAHGADAVALAAPLLDAAVDGVDAVVERLEQLLYSLRVICFCAGARTVAELRQVRVIDVAAGYPIG